jgi:GAF domain-containing protein
MGRRSRAASNRAKGRVRHASGRKPRKTPTRRASTADLQQRLDRAVREREEAFEREAAAADILRVISRSPTDTQPVFEAIVRAGLKLFPGAGISLALAQGDEVRAAAVADFDPTRARAWRSRFPFPLSREYMHGVAILDAKIIDIPDVADAPANLSPGAHNFLTTGYRAITIVPLMRGGTATGALSVIRRAPGPLSDEQLTLLNTFAAQAVIAIENTRLLNELRQRTDNLTESLQQQTATADVLRVMSRTKFDLMPVLQSVVDAAARLCRADQAVIFRLEDGLYRFAAGFSLVAEYLEIERANPIAPGPGTAVGRAAMNHTVVRIEDAMTDPGYAMKEQAAIAQLHSIIGVPLLRDGEPIGVIALARCRVEPFSEREIELVTTFADQAVIAIENVRLFDEVQARTRDLSESLEQQTATSEVLGIISSSPGELQPVFDAMLESAIRICAAKFGALYLCEGGEFQLVAMNGIPPEVAAKLQRGPRRVLPITALGRVAATRETVHIADVQSEPGYFEVPPGFTPPQLSNIAGVRSCGTDA